MASTRNDSGRAPDGIDERHVHLVEGWRRHASPFSLAAFATVIVLALTGLLGHERDWVAEANAATLRVHSPEIIRNGEFFEIRVAVETAEPIGDLRIGVDAALWEDMTVNTMIPAATEEMSEDGEFAFTFGPLEPGTAFDLKVDLQVNPDIVGGNAGSVTLYDGDDVLAAVDMSISVLP
jgi:hypothetical protein